MDEAIERAVAQQRAVGMMHLQWMLDEWKLSMGMLEVQPRKEFEEEDYFENSRRLFRRKPKEGPRERPYRMLPLFNGYCLLVRDKE